MSGDHVSEGSARGTTHPMSAGPGPRTDAPARSVRLGGLFFGAGAGGFLTATAVSQVLRWRSLADGTRQDDRALADVHGLAVAASLAQLSIWILAVVGIGLLWNGSERGDRRLSGRTVTGWALVGWGAITGLLGLADLVVAADARRALDAALIAAGLVLVGLGLRLVRTPLTER